MLRKDYIQRQFEEFGKVLAQILILKKNKDWEELEKVLAEATQKFIRKELNALESLNDEAFSKEVLTPQLSSDQKKILANILFEKMNEYLERSERKAYENLRSKCILLYTYLLNDLTQNEFDLEAHYRLQVLKS